MMKLTKLHEFLGLTTDVVTAQLITTNNVQTVS